MFKKANCPQNCNPSWETLSQLFDICWFVTTATWLWPTFALRGLGSTPDTHYLITHLPDIPLISSLASQAAASLTLCLIVRVSSHPATRQTSYLLPNCELNRDVVWSTSLNNDRAHKIKKDGFDWEPFCLFRIWWIDLVKKAQAFQPASPCWNKGGGAKANRAIKTTGIKKTVDSPAISTSVPQMWGHAVLSSSLTAMLSTLDSPY